MAERLHQRKGSWLATVNAVLWGFLGVRRQADYQSDIAKLNPLHLMAVGVGMSPAGAMCPRLYPEFL